MLVFTLERYREEGEQDETLILCVLYDNVAWVSTWMVRFVSCRLVSGSHRPLIPSLNSNAHPDAQQSDAKGEIHLVIMTVVSSNEQRLRSPRKASPHILFWILWMVVFCTFIGLWACIRLVPSEKNPDAIMLLKEWIQVGTPVKPIRNDQDLCRYEGHCPIGYTCVIHQGSSQGGLCEPYIFNDAPRLLETDPCIQACMDELRWEDHHQFARRPEQLEYFMSTGSGRPNWAMHTSALLNTGGRSRCVGPKHARRSEISKSNNVRIRVSHATTLLIYESSRVESVTYRD